MGLLERDPFLTELSRRLQEGTAGKGSLVLVAGEAGVGKTALIQAFSRTVDGTARLLIGACDPLSTPRPLGPLVDIAAEVGGELDRLLATGEHRHRAFRTFLELLQHPDQPVLVVIEDVHWADEATLDLLRFLGRRIASTRALVVTTHRDDEVGPQHPLRVVLGDLATAPAIRRITLPPLSAAAVGVLAQGSGLDPVALYRQTNGNPFFVTEVLAGDGDGIPPTVRDAVLARLARLSPAARALLDVAAVIGTSVEAALLVAAAGAEEDAVEECLGKGMLRAEVRGYAFRHEMVREAILAELTPQRRMALHRAVLGALRGSEPGPDDLARLAHHAEEAGDRAAVLAYAPAAARQATRLQAHRAAAAQYARALRFAERLDPVERAALLEARAFACYLLGELDAAIQARDEALAIWRRQGNRLKEGENLRWLSRLSWRRGYRSDAERFAQAALEVLERLPPGPQLAMAYSSQAQLRMLAFDADEAIAWGERAIALAEQYEDTETLIHALNNVGTARLVVGDERGHALLERSLQLALEADSEDDVARALSNLGTVAMGMYQVELADRYLTEALAYCIDRDLDANLFCGLGTLTVIRLRQGRWAEAAETAGQVMRRPGISPITYAEVLTALGCLRVRRGDPEVDSALDRALELAASVGELQELGPVYAARAEAAWLAGDLTRAAAEARAAYGLALRCREPWLVGELAYWQMRAGEPPADIPDWIAEPFALQLQGNGQAAADAWYRLGCPYEQARALAESDDPAALRQALDICAQLGARPLAAFATRRLREMGARRIPRGPRPSTRVNAAQLTQRELEIAQLLAAGLRNAEIAERLYLSRKTVEHHVSAVLAKLDATTRTEAAARAAALGIVAPI